MSSRKSDYTAHAIHAFTWVTIKWVWDGGGGQESSTNVFLYPYTNKPDLLLLTCWSVQSSAALEAVKHGKNHSMSEIFCDDSIQLSRKKMPSTNRDEIFSRKKIKNTQQPWPQSTWMCSVVASSQHNPFYSTKRAHQLLGSRLRNSHRNCSDFTLEGALTMVECNGIERIRVEVDTIHFLCSLSRLTVPKSLHISQFQPHTTEQMH